jgi:hypothetical protein
MERMACGIRQSGMMSPRQVRGTVYAVLLCSALAGCGSVAATAPAGAGGTSSAAATSSASAATSSASAASSAVASSSAAAAPAGCAGVNQATSVTVHRVMRLVEPTRPGALTKTQHNVALVRELFGQFCAAVSHPAAKSSVVRCPADFGVSYLGTFYDGSQPLARFVYGASGCQSVSLTADGETRATRVLGPAAAAAPKLGADMAAVLGMPTMAIGQPVR